MFLLALKRSLARRLPLVLAVTCAVMGVNWYKRGDIGVTGVLLIFAIALAATLLLELPMQYMAIKRDRRN